MLGEGEFTITGADWITRGFQTVYWIAV